MICIKMPWPPREWTEADDAYLRERHGIATLREIANEMHRSRSSIRARITRLGIAKKVLWTDAEEQALVELYRQAGRDGVLHLNEFAKAIGRDPGNVSRKAGWMGLETNPKRRVVEQRKDKIRKYATDEELRAAMSERAKRMIAEKGHPRGMLGRRHSDETRLHLSRTGKAAALLVTEEQRSERVLKALKTRSQRGEISFAPKVRRGSWNAGWRVIGDKRNYYRSRWEANYARYLQWLKERGEIVEWQHEPETFWFEAIKRGVRSYLPDFRVWEKNGTSCLHEVKGWMDARSRTCLKRMAKYHPHEKLILIDGRQYRAIRLKVMRLIEGWEDASRDNHA